MSHKNFATNVERQSDGPCCSNNQSVFILLVDKDFFLIRLRSWGNTHTVFKEKQTDLVFWVVLLLELFNKIVSSALRFLLFRVVSDFCICVIFCLFLCILVVEAHANSFSKLTKL